METLAMLRLKAWSYVPACLFQLCLEGKGSKRVAANSVAEEKGNEQCRW